MMNPRRRIRGPGPLLILCLLLSGLPGAGAASYPDRSVDLIVPWAAGGGSDRVARFVADALQRRFHQPVIVINRTGGSGVVGHSAGAFAAPDGYTLTLATFELSTMNSMGISAITWTNFTPVAQVNADAAALIVRQDAPWRQLGDLLEAIRREPGRFKMSGTATGGAWDLARAGLLLAAGIAPTNVIWAPTQGSAPALVELLGGHIDVVSCSVPEAASQLEGGQARVLAVLSPQRLSLFPDYPTAREQGVAYDAVGWRGLMMPAGASREVVAALEKALVEITQSPEFAAFMKKNGFATEVRIASAFGDFLREQESKWSKVIQQAGYKSLGRNADPGPRTLPIALAVIFVGTLGAEALRTRQRRSQPNQGEADAVPGSDGESDGSTRRTFDALFLVVGLGIYLAALPWIGFNLGTGLFASVMMWRLGVRWWRAGLGAAVLVLAIHLLFVNVFKVPLP